MLGAGKRCLWVSLLEVHVKCRLWVCTMHALPFLRQKQICFDLMFYLNWKRWHFFLSTKSRGTPTASGAFLAPRATFPGALPQGRRRWRAGATVLDQEERKVWHDVVRRGAPIWTSKVLKIWMSHEKSVISCRWKMTFQSRLLFSATGRKEPRKNSEKKQGAFWAGPGSQSRITIIQDPRSSYVSASNGDGWLPICFDWYAMPSASQSSAKTSRKDWQRYGFQHSIGLGDPCVLI